MTRLRFLLALAMAALPLLAAGKTQRLIVLTDIGADPDDQQSLVRLLLYSNQIDIEGIVATTSCWQQSRVRPELITAIVEAYGKVQPNLLQHEPGFPSADDLHLRTKTGRPEYGMQGVGEGKDSDGSDWIIRALEKDDDRPVWISVWGGANTLAQALFTIDRTKSREEARRLVAKLRVYTISDQDDSGSWIRRTFPELFYIVTPGDDYGRATWIAINNTYEGIDNTTISNPWLAQHIQQGHGPLGAAYPDVAWGMEGDTPAYLGLIPNGLNAPEHPDWGGWGGRYALGIPAFDTIKDDGSIVVPEPETRPIWTNTSDTYTPYVPDPYKRAVKRGERAFSGDHVTLWRWRDDLQHDFAARMDWCTQGYAEANHPPVPTLDHPAQITVKSGQGFGLSAEASSDPDGDSLSFLWFSYPEAGTCTQPVKIEGAENAPGAWFTAPRVEKPGTVHIVLRVTDKGTPALSRYQRVIVTVTP